MKTNRIIFRTFVTVALGVALAAAPVRSEAALDTNSNINLTPSAPWQASGVSEVMKMFKGGISAEIIVSYVNTSQLSFYMSADTIISLQQQGVPQPVLTAMLARYGESQRQAPMAQNNQAPASRYPSVPQEDPAANFNAALQARAATTYAPTYVAAPSYPVYQPYSYAPYSYDPYYNDPFYTPWYGWSSPVVFDFGFGGRFGGRGFDRGFGGRVGGFADHGGFAGHGGGGFAGHGGGFGGHGGGHR